MTARQVNKRTIPSGHIAFLFTDIVGSTVRWEADPEGMRLDVRRHDALMHQAIESHNGYVFKTLGDAFCAAFWTVDDAVQAALDAQRAISSEHFASGLAARMAVHAGDSDERDSDYFGPTLNRVARLLAIGHGGQVLLSNAAAGSASGLADAHLSLRDLGNHRLKDLTTPEHVFQVVAEDLQSEFPQLRSLSLVSNNLPQQATSFVGRDEDVARIKELVQRSRLVTLTGSGGVGKTRCALQVAADLFEPNQDGVWFADLAPLRDPSLVASTVGRIFELQEPPDNSMSERLVAFLKSKKLLLILDNCEHVIGEAAKITSLILRSCPDARILATSREALNVAGESVYRMPSLGVPERSRGVSAQEALSYGAVALFEERGRNVKTSFVVTNENAEAVAEVCRQLDGIPLAIELAAARLTLLSPNQLAQKLNERLRILTGGDRAALPRQQTMRALIDWSYDLLAESEQRVFRHVSAFAGGFTIDAATALCINELLDEIGVFEIVSSLVSKSLMLAEPWEDGTRYRLLGSTREYAREKLHDRGEESAALERHARIFADYVEQLSDQYETMTPRAWILYAEVEIENLRSALHWALSEKGDVLVAQRIAATLPRIFGAIAPVEGERWVKAAMDRIDESTPGSVVAELELAQATFASVFNHFNAALRAAQRALAEFTALKYTAGIADAQRFVGRSLVYTGKPDEGEVLLQEALRIHRARGSRRIGSILGDLAVARALQGDVAGARELFWQASETFAESADASKLAITAATLAEAEFRAGNAEEAIRLAGEAAAGARSLGRLRTLAAILRNIAAYELELNRYNDATVHALEALDLCSDGRGDEALVVFTLQHLAVAGALRPSVDAEDPRTNHLRAAHILGFVEGRLAAIDVVREYTELRGYAALAEELRRSLGDELQSVLDAGSAWNEERAIAAARTLSQGVQIGS